jgi:hypothetical protein
MKILYIILFCSIALFAQEKDSTLIEYDFRINYCDSLHRMFINEIVDSPMKSMNSDQIRILILNAREWAIRKDIFEEAKRIYLDKQEAISKRKLIK